VKGDQVRVNVPQPRALHARATLVTAVTAQVLSTIFREKIKTASVRS